MRISVIIPSYRRDDLLQRCLDALAVQQFPATQYEILVVDDGRSATTRTLVERMAKRLGAHPALRYLTPPGGVRGPAAARNAGWRGARGEIVAFTDYDTVATPQWLHEAARAMVGEPGSQIGAAWGPVSVPLPPEPTDFARNSAGLEQAVFTTANAFVRRRVLMDIDGFDERFKRAWREDADLYFTLLERGYRVVHAPGALMRHPVREAPFGISLKQQRNMLFDALLFKKHPHLYCTKIASRPPLGYYLAVFALCAGCELLLLKQAGPALVAFSIWFGYTLCFTLQRLHGTSHAPRHVLEMLLTSAAIPLLAVLWRLAGAFRFRVVFA